jgi:hypothetical protein
MIYLLLLLLLVSPAAHAQDAPVEPIPHLTITRPVAPPETQPVPRASLPQDGMPPSVLQAAAARDLNDQAESASKACDTPIKARINWLTIDPQDIAGLSSGRVCEAALNALAEACKISAARDKIEAEIGEVICTAGTPAPALELRAGALIYTIDWQARNPAVFIYSWLLSNL